MSLWIIKGSDFVGALKRAFQEHDPANVDYLMTEFSIADHGVTKRQNIKFIDGAWRQEAPQTAIGNGRRPVSKSCTKTLTLFELESLKSPHKNLAGGPLSPDAHAKFDPRSS